ncbi:MAG: hypothetical protein QN209_12150 [Armatimonadota bacterium]|nr:hypothetical protein [Armatimonadota bacterium]
MREMLQVSPLLGYEPEVGRWLCAMQEVRRRTVGLVQGLDLQQNFPSRVAAWFPFEMADATGRLTRVLSVPLAEHLSRLERSRAIFLEVFRGISLAEWRRPRSPANVDYAVTPEWVVFHLLEHEAGHAFQISTMKSRAARSFGG